VCQTVYKTVNPTAQFQCRTEIVGNLRYGRLKIICVRRISCLEQERGARGLGSWAVVGVRGGQ
jgi:hypothetical protein